jgi:hypothetical protein
MHLVGDLPHCVGGASKARHHTSCRRAELLGVAIHCRLLAPLQRIRLVGRGLQPSRLLRIALEHQHGLRHLADFVAAFGGRNLRLQVTAGEPAHGRRHRQNRPRREPAEQRRYDD